MPKPFWRNISRERRPQFAVRRGPADRKKKYTAHGLGRRGRPLTSQTAFGGQLPYKGSLVRPAVRFGHSRSEYNGRFLRATNNEPRATIFSRAEGHSRRCRHSESVAAKRHLSPRRPANCQLRPAGPSGPKFNERPTMNGFLGPNILFAKYFSCYSWGNCVQ